MIDPRDKARQPVARFLRKLPLDLRNRAAEIDKSQGVVKIKRYRPHHLADAAESEAPQDLYLAKPEMCMNKAEGNGQIAVGFSLDERDLMAVPVNLDPPVNGDGFLWKYRQSLR